MTRFLDWLKGWIANVATTPLIITSGVALSWIYVIWALAADSLGRPISELTLETLGMFLMGMLVGGVAQFAFKRTTDHGYVAAKKGNGHEAARASTSMPKVDG